MPIRTGGYRTNVDVLERRSATRVVVRAPVRFAAFGEHPMPGAEAIDASYDGVLLALAEPVGLVPNTRVCVSWSTERGALHLLGHVRRVQRGDDFRTYVALSIEEPGNAEDLELWRSTVDPH